MILVHLRFPQGLQFKTVPTLNPRPLGALPPSHPHAAAAELGFLSFGHSVQIKGPPNNHSSMELLNHWKTGLGEEAGTGGPCMRHGPCSMPMKRAPCTENPSLPILHTFALHPALLGEPQPEDTG